MKRFISYLSVVIALATVPTVRSDDCTQTRYFSLAPNDRPTVATLEALFPELLFEFDGKAGLLTVTGCDDQITLAQPAIIAAKSGDPAKLHAEIENELWHRLPQPGLFRHPIYGFDLLNQDAAWTTVTTAPDAAWAKRINGHPLFGLTLAQKTARLIVLVTDVDGTQTAQQMGAVDAKLPPATAPQAVADLKWADAAMGRAAWLIAPPPQVTSYSTRTLWLTGKEKFVAERTYVAQPSAAGQFTRFYLFETLVPYGDYNPQARRLDMFLRGLRLPASPLSPILKKTPDNLVVAARQDWRAATEATQYKPRLVYNASPLVQRALARGTTPMQAEQLWRELLPTLAQSEVPEALGHLGFVEFAQRKYPQAEQTFRRIQEEFPTDPLAFQATLQRGIVLGYYLHDLVRAEAVLLVARRLARDDSERWRADCQLAVVPFFRKQYKPALQALEQLLDDYPTLATANFVRPYLWYLKNCTQKKL
ncbi:MAG: hypothetical protein WCG79_10370 [Verrucomicrobiota bacterium]